MYNYFPNYYTVHNNDFNRKFEKLKIEKKGIILF